MKADADAAAALADTLRRLGTDAQFVRAKAPADPPVLVRVLLSHVSPRDEAIVNAFGIDALLLTFDHNAVFRAQEPEKFDVVLLGTPSATYVFEAIHPVDIAGTRIGWTAYSKGRGG